jgi:hypothetical protein
MGFKYRWNYINKVQGLNSCSSILSYSVGGDPHSINVASGTTQVDYTFHTTSGRTVGFLNPSNGNSGYCADIYGGDEPDDIDNWDSTNVYFTTYTGGKLIKLSTITISRAHSLTTQYQELVLTQKA